MNEPASIAPSSEFLSCSELATVTRTPRPRLDKWLQRRLVVAERRATGRGHRNKFSVLNAVGCEAMGTLREAGFSADQAGAICAWISGQGIDLLADQTHNLLLAVGGQVPLGRLISRDDLRRLDLFGVLTSAKPIAVLDLAAMRAEINERLTQIRRPVGQENSSTTTSTRKVAGRSGCDAGPGGGPAI